MPTTDPVTSISIWYHLILTQYHQVPTIAVLQGDFNCGASSQTDFILNYFLSKSLKFPHISTKILKFPQISKNILKFPLKFSISSQPG